MFEPSSATLPLPPELVEASAEALERVKEAEAGGEPETVVGDDLLQAGGLCGGADDRDLSAVEFTFHAAGGERWDLRLARIELEDLADGFPERLTLWQCPHEGCGRRFNRKARAAAHMDAHGKPPSG